MRRSATRHGRIERQPYLDRPIGTRSIVAAYALALLVPLVLWAISNPLLAAGGVTVIGGLCVAGRIGARAARRRLRSQPAVCIPRTDLCVRVVSR
jgi:hypothetical protein